MVGWGGENLDQSLRTQPAPSTLRMTNMFLGRRSWLCGGEIMMAKDIVGTKRFLLFFMLAFTDWSYRLEFWILHIKDAYTKQCNECNVMIRRKVMNQIVEAACMQRTPSWHTCGASLMIHEHEPNTPWKQDRSLFACVKFWFVGCCSWVGSWLKASYRVLT